MQEDAKPTRSEELRLKEEIELAENGHSILEQKRDGLIHEFMKVVDEARNINQEIAELYSEALNRYHVAEVHDGETEIRSAALSSPDNLTEVETQNIMGVEVPSIEKVQASRTLMERGYGLSGSSRIDETAEIFEELLEKIVEAAEIQTRIMRLLEEIEKTKRRVNALEHEVIPAKQDALDDVSETLMEREREETFRMKKIKEMQEEG